MKPIFYFILIVLSVSACKKDCVASENTTCICTTEFDPVCGCDDITYSNTCIAECVGITEFTKGKCK